MSALVSPILISPVNAAILLNPVRGRFPDAHLRYDEARHGFEPSWAVVARRETVSADRSALAREDGRAMVLGRSETAEGAIEAAVLAYGN